VNGCKQVGYANSRFFDYRFCCYELIKYDLNIMAIKCNFYNRLWQETATSFILQKFRELLNCQDFRDFRGSFHPLKERVWVWVEMGECRWKWAWWICVGGRSVHARVGWFVYVVTQRCDREETIPEWCALLTGNLHVVGGKLFFCWLFEEMERVLLAEDTRMCE
jgi:hypothetical protein